MRTRRLSLFSKVILSLSWEPVDANAACFSHRSYALLLRACTEFESLAKELLVEGGAAKAPARMDVNDYRTLEPTCKFDEVTVDFLPWRPHPKRVFPYKGWATAQPPLRWYADYNDVKHNRNTSFPLASLQTLVESVSALFCLIAKASSYDWGPIYSKGRNDNGEDFSRGSFVMRSPLGTIAIL